MNISKDLRRLFRESLKHKNISVVDYRGSSTQHNVLSFADTQFKIYFYEWSDIYRVPRTFNDIESFNEYLKKCGIYMQLYQREIIYNCKTVYATCYKGTKELNLRGSYAILQDSMKEKGEVKNEKKDISFEPFVNLSDGIQDKRPISPMYSQSTIQRPPMVEPEGRWDEDCYGIWY